MANYTLAVTNVVDDTHYVINGQPVDTLAVIRGVDGGEQTAPEWRDRDLEIPGAHGVLDYGADVSGPRRSYGPGTFPLSGTVLGVDPQTGLWDPGQSYGVYLQRVSDLMRMFYARNLTIDAVRPDGTRRAVGHLTGSIMPTRTPGDPWFGRWQATIRIPGSFWSDTVSTTVSATVATGASVGLGALATGEAPIGDATIVFGPGSNPVLLQGGMFLAYDGVIAAGRQLTVDAATGEVGPGSGSAWSPDPGKLRCNPGPAWFEIDPTAGQFVTFTHTAGGSMYVAVTGRRKFLTS